MGNCQAAAAAAAVIQHPGSGNKVERIYWSISANEVMNSHPGHYVAMLVGSPEAARTENGTPVRQLKLLRPDDTLLIGHVYRLISFEDVLKEFAAKKCVKLGKLLKERGVFNVESRRNRGGLDTKSKLKSGVSIKIKTEQQRLGISESGSGSSRGVGRHHGGQWRPALQSIAEIGN